MERVRPVYQDNIALNMEIAPIQAVCGNIDDLHPAYGASPGYGSLSRWLFDLYTAKSTSPLVFYSPHRGFYNDENSSHLEAFTGLCGKRPGRSFAEASTTLSDIARQHPTASFTLIIEDASRLCCNAATLNETEKEAFGNLKRAFATLGAMHRRLIMLLDSSNDLPSFLLNNKSLLRVVDVPAPDTVQRRQLAENIYGRSRFSESDLARLADAATGMRLIELARVLAAADGEGMDAAQITEKVKLAKYGFKENPWKQISAARLRELSTALKRLILGQDEVIDSVVSALINARYGSGAARRGGTPPKEVLVFGGPTGVGKTKTARLLAELLLGSPDCLARIDMNEFSDAHNKARLIGSPPGYVGYGTSGELPRVLRENPFRVLLFDEFEKAAREVLDILLVMVDEGRITAGTGETYSVENCVIIFTTNLGAERIVAGEDAVDAVREMIKRFVRPEMFGRIEKGITVFRPLDQAAAAGIFDLELANLLEYNLRENRLQISFSESVVAKLKAKVVSSLSPESGGRGIVRAFDQIVDALLSKFKISHGDSDGKIMIDGITVADGAEHFNGIFTPSERSGAGGPHSSKHAPFGTARVFTLPESEGGLSNKRPRIIIRERS